MGADYFVELDGLRGEDVRDRKNHSPSKIDSTLEGEKGDASQTEGMDLEGFDRVLDEVKKIFKKVENESKEES